MCDYVLVLDVCLSVYELFCVCVCGWVSVYGCE